ncbi:interleukin-2 receptor subunit beta-like [Arapaima gigas]
MGTVWLVLLLLLLGFFPWWNLGVESLKCYSDFVNNVTCVWNSKGVAPETACTLNTLHYGVERICSLMCTDGPGQHLRSCHLLFQDNFGRLSKFDIKVKCENLTTPVANITNYQPSRHIKMHPPGLPSCINSTIMWSPGEPLSKMIFSYSFQLQYKTSEETWEGVQLIDVKNKQTFLQLPEDRLVKGTVYQTRVRVKCDGNQLSGEWSDWSYIASWRSTVGSSRSGSPEGQNLLRNPILLVTIPVVLVCLLLLFILKTQGFSWAYKEKPVPDPSKFFKVLNSVHNGNFQEWLSPAFAPESFSVSQFAEDISIMEIISIKHTTTHCVEKFDKLSEDCHYINQPSNFFKMGYFCSKHKSEDCSTCYVYQLAGSSAEENADMNRLCDSGPFQNSSSYRLLE